MDPSNFLDGFTGTIGNFLPGVIGAIAVLLIGWFIAGLARRLTRRLLQRTDLDNRIFKSSKSSFSPEKFLSKLVYYLVLMIVLMVVLEMLGVQNVLDPIKDMVNKFLGFVPNLVAAGIIGFAGYIIATLVSEVVGFAGERLEAFSSKMGFSDSMNLTKLAKQVVFILVFIPIFITALDTLQLAAISEPAKDLLSTLFNAIPNILVAAVIIAGFYFIGSYLQSVGTEILRNLGTDRLPARLGITGVIGENQSLSKLITNVAFFFLMFTGITMAVEKLNFVRMSDMLNDLLALSGQIFFGLVVLAIGSLIASFAHRALLQGKNNEFLASIARVVILGLFLAIALRTMGIANDIVNLAFGLTLGAVAVAVALSFGLGGRAAAGKQMEHMLGQFRKKDSGLIQRKPMKTELKD